jgi:hypothetical protein
MVLQKRRSTTLEKALSRLRGLQSAHPTMDLGNGLTLQGYSNLIDASGARLQAYHLALTEADRTRIEFAELEASVALLSSRILSAIAAQYGRDSKEYELAGGKPPSAYKRAKQQSVTSLSAASLSATDRPASQGGNGASGAASSTGAVMNGARALT